MSAALDLLFEHNKQLERELAEAVILVRELYDAHEMRNDEYDIWERTEKFLERTEK